MLDEITRSVIREGTTEQLHPAFDGLAESMSLRSAQRLGIDRSLNEMAAEINARGNRR
jgi:hypothetical protein